MKNKLIYSICFFSMLVFTFTSCEEDGVLSVEIPTAISFNVESNDVLVQPGGTDYVLEVQSTTPSDVDRTFTTTLDAANSTGLPAEYSFNGSITIPAGSLMGSSSINFNYDEIPLGVSRELIFDLNPVGSDAVLNTVRSSTSISYSAFCPHNTVVLSFTFDSWPEEIGWELYDSTNAVIADSAYGAYNGLEGSLSKIFCLESGDYTFIIYDSYGDGSGPFTLTLEDGTVLVSSDGGYGTGEATGFTL